MKRKPTTRAKPIRRKAQIKSPGRAANAIAPRKAGHWIQPQMRIKP